MNGTNFQFSITNFPNLLDKYDAYRINMLSSMQTGGNILSPNIDPYDQTQDIFRI